MGQTSSSASSSFLKSFTAALVKLDAKRAPPQQAMQLLAWSALILENLELDTAAKAAARLIQCQVRACLSLSCTMDLNSDAAIFQAVCHWPQACE